MKLIGIAIYLLVLLLIGVIASRRMRDLRDYYAGGKRFGFWAAAFSSRATGESAWLLLGLTGMGAAVGAQALWVVVGEVLGVAAAWIFLCFKFVAPQLPLVGPSFSSLSELPPAFVVSAIMAVTVSLFDRSGREAIRDVEYELTH